MSHVSTPHPSTGSIRRAAPLAFPSKRGAAPPPPLPATDIRDPRLLDEKSKPQKKKATQASVGSSWIEWSASHCSIHDSRSAVLQLFLTAQEPTQSPNNGTLNQSCGEVGLTAADNHWQWWDLMQVTAVLRASALFSTRGWNPAVASGVSLREPSKALDSVWLVLVCSGPYDLTLGQRNQRKDSGSG